MIDKNNFEELLIRNIENDLTPNEQAGLNAFLGGHPEFLADVEAFNKTILTPDSDIVFLNKDSLKKPVSGRKALWLNPWLSISVAASIVALIAIGFWVRMNFHSATNDYALSNTKRNLNISGTSQPAIIKPRAANAGSAAHLQKNNSNATSSNHKERNPSSFNKAIVSVNHSSTGYQNKNMAEAVTYFSSDTLHLLETNQIDGIVYIDDARNKISPMEITTMVNNCNQLQSENNKSKGGKMLAGLIKRSGSKSLAKAFEEYHNLKNRKYEISYSSALLSFHKTFNSNQ